jgi:hypothetical protein
MDKEVRQRDTEKVRHIDQAVAVTFYMLGSRARFFFFFFSGVLLSQNG